jgi:hypothetical protein
MITRTFRLLAAALVVAAAAGGAPAFADGRKGKQAFEAPKVPKLKTGKLASKTPCPLGPGERFTTGERPTKHTYNCSGAFVVTDNVASSVTLPDHMETVAPIIHRAGEPDACDRGCTPQPHAEIAPPPVPQKTATTVTLSDSFGNGGVGAGVTGGSSYSRAYIVSGGSAQGYASASAVTFAFASSHAVAGGGAHGCGCGR